MRLCEKTNRLEVVLALLLIQLILLPAALGVTYASSGTRRVLDAAGNRGVSPRPVQQIG